MVYSKENSEHAVKAGLKNSDKIRGSKNYKAKLDECKVKEILQSFMTPTEVANTYGISISVASKIIKRQTWKHVEL
jgi:DNA invertase Pin-like site-specific DNA recombinase